MKSIEIIGFKRANLGKTESARLRDESNVPCVLYGGQEQIHFYAPMILFRDLIYTPAVYIVDLNIEGEHRRAVVQEAQFHPVNEMIMHVDFLELNENKEIKIDVPVKLTGVSPGVQMGGKLVTKLRKIKIKSLPADLPDFVEIDISELELGKSVKVSKVKAQKYTILSNPQLPVATVAIPRALKSAQSGQ